MLNVCINQLTIYKVYEKRLEASDKCRNDGNDCFRRGDSDLARQYYLAALYHVDFDIGTLFVCLAFCNMLYFSYFVL